MDAPRRAVVAAVALIAAVTLVSGPLVGAVDLTREPDDGPGGGFGNGSATVSVTDFPDSVAIEQGRYGSQQYFLRVPDATVDIADIEGQPFLKYDLYIEEMALSKTTTVFLDPSYEGQNTLSIDEQAFDPEEIDRRRYNATLTISLRADGDETVIQRERFAMEVRE